MKRSILIVDDEADLCELLRRSLAPELDCVVETAASGEEALLKLSGQAFDLVLADIKMPGMDGLELLEIIKRERPGQTVVMMTAFGHIDTAVRAMKSGAYDFITKPFEHEALVVRLEKALERAALIRENQRLLDACSPLSVFQELVGKSAVMQRLYETIRMAAQTDLTVLITGESGTGKELTARAVHALSARSRGPFVAVNCPAVPEAILESELFGYRKGAFTQATENRIGLFQEARGGTIFLDEIGDVSPAIQTKLLRVLQEKEIKPLGETRSVVVDVRILASTNQDLAAKIKAGQFREDFFYRLNVLPIRVPSLREHREDIPLIANHLLVKHCAAMQRPLKRLSAEVMRHFAQRDWTGNVRELENLVMRGISFSSGEEIGLEDLGFEAAPAVAGAAGSGRTALPSGYKEAKKSVLESFHRKFLGTLLAACRGNVSEAARRCGLERQALQQVMRRYGIRADSFR